MFFFPAWSMKLNGLGTVFTGIITELLLMRVFFFLINFIRENSMYGCSIFGKMG